MPLVVPDWLTGESREKYIKAAITEASSVYHNQLDKPYLFPENLNLFPTADPLREWDSSGSLPNGMGTSTRKEILARCHLAYERNPLANTAVSLTTKFVVGEGFNMSYKNKQVEEVLEAFRENPENGIEDYEKSFCDDLQIDGELFIRYRSDPFGNTIITPLKPWEIWWIKATRGMFKRVESYRWAASLTDGSPGDFEFVMEDVPAAEILHVTINKHSYEQRGRPDLFRLLPWLKAYKDWLENRARQNHWRGALLWDVSLTDATPQQVAAKRAQYKQPPPPGSLTIHNDKEIWEPKENKSNANDVSEDGRQLKLMVAVGAELPEYMLADGQYATRATSHSQQLPALRKFSDFQDIMISQTWEPIYDTVLNNAVAAGILPAEVEEQDEEGKPITDEIGMPKMLKVCEAYDVTGPEIESDDPKTLSEALTAYSGLGIISKETTASRAGFDYRKELKNIRREQQADAQATMQGLGFGPAPSPGAQTLQDLFGLDAAGNVPTGQQMQASESGTFNKAWQTAVMIEQRLSHFDEQNQTEEKMLFRILEIIKKTNAPVVRLDEEMLRRIADEAASRTADKLSVLSQEVIQRDDKGRAAIIQRITADNSTSYYQVNRNTAGGVESLTRVEITV